MGYVSFGWTGETRNIAVELDDDENVWYTVHSDGGGNDDPIMTRIFGTNRLPTPWTGETDKDTVIKELADRNPHATVG